MNKDADAPRVLPPGEHARKFMRKFVESFTNPAVSDLAKNWPTTTTNARELVLRPLELFERYQRDGLTLKEYTAIVDKVLADICRDQYAKDDSNEYE